MRAPYWWWRRNIAFGPGGSEDPWALFRVETESYEGKSVEGKSELLWALAGALYALESDVQLLRVSRPWSIDDYLDGARTTLDARHGHPDGFDDHLLDSASSDDEHAPARPEVYLASRLPRQATLARLGATLSGQGSLGARVRAALGAVGLSDPRALSKRAVDALEAAESKTMTTLGDYLPADRASTAQAQWLIRRAHTRGLGEPAIDEHFAPQALLVQADERDGGAAWEPTQTDLLRLFDSVIHVEQRAVTRASRRIPQLLPYLRICSELGESYQAVLAFGALPESAVFPGPQTELLFDPLERLPFAVDACLNARYIANDQALAMARRRIIHADNIWREENTGDHGPTSAADERPAQARELEAYLADHAHPPLLRATISLALGAPSFDELEDRIAEVRRAYGAVPQLHVPVGEQLRLWRAHLPAQRCDLRDYDDYLLLEQVGAMVPTATNAVGSQHGPKIGHTVPSRHPVLHDLAEAAQSDRTTLQLLLGTPGSGKTLLMGLLCYQAFLQGSGPIVDVDPKGHGDNDELDHKWLQLPGVADATERIELSAAPEYRGMLDPLRIGEPGRREDLTYSFLVSLLPEPIPPQWRTELRLAIQEATTEDARSCGAVLKRLQAGKPEANDAARAIEIHANSGLAGLGFAPIDGQVEEIGAKQVIALSIRNLRLPPPGTNRGSFREEERLGLALLELLAAYTLRLTTENSRRHALAAFDEGHNFLDYAPDLLVRFARLGRSRNVTPLVATQLLGDVEAIRKLAGCLFLFGVEDLDEAGKALALAGLDADDERRRTELTRWRRGRCYMRDIAGRVASVQIDPGARLLHALATTPSRRNIGDGRPDAA